VWIAVLLAGGRGSRLGGRHKPGITVAGTTLLDRALATVGDADEIVVVGPEQPVRATVRWTVEQPPGGGPVAALAAGLAAASTTPHEVVLLAADLVGITDGTVRRLRHSLPGHDGAVLCDAAGRRQWLIGVWRHAALRTALPPDPSGMSLRTLLSGLDLVDVPESPGESADVDTPADLAKLVAYDGPVTGSASQPSHW
jgi:molybdopterin-guanine dinucleotide biosynthesis protein A